MTLINFGLFILKSDNSKPASFPLEGSAVLELRVWERRERRKGGRRGKVEEEEDEDEGCSSKKKTTN